MSTTDGWRIRMLVALYPPAWRARYADEFSALLADSGVRLATELDVVAAAVRVWLHPPVRLHDHAGRMRTTVGVTSCAWAALAAGTILFAKLTTDGAVFAHGRGAGWYDVFTFAAFGSVLAMAAAWLPLSVAMVRRSRYRARVVAPLVAPAVLVLGFLAAAAALAGLLRHHTRTGAGIGMAGFLLLAVLGVVTAAGCAACPALALMRSRPDGPALTVAVVAGLVATAAMVIATIAAVGYTMARARSAGVAVFALVMAAALTVAAVSGVRGLRAVTAAGSNNHAG
ncbi:hypothetical protein [Streptomyces sp. TP-A0356]|uniref:hypothetical protein n=1 Tax=Streptomyces sp. TP-A0356 TaxID=1359208 RepID=UPI001F484B98|nr:hypothetical protein [Streptomyces sp. TP-A0356]